MTIAVAVLSGLSIGFTLGACEKAEPVKVDAATVEARLAKADAVDGKTDKVVAKCAACALGMDGNAEHSLQAHGYTLHLCSADCKEGFAENVDQSIMAMEIPE